MAWARSASGLIKPVPPAAGFSETLIQWSNQVLSTASYLSAGSSMTFGAIFVTPASIGDASLWQGNTGFGVPGVYYEPDGSLTDVISNNAYYHSATGFILPNTRYAYLSSVSTTKAQHYIRAFGGAWTALTNTTGAMVMNDMAGNYLGNYQAGSGQFTGKTSRLFLAPGVVDLSDSAVQNAFCDSSLQCVLPSNFRSLFASYGFDFCGDLAASNAGTNPGTFGSFSRSGSAFT